MNIYDYSQYYNNIRPDEINPDMTVKRLIEWYLSDCGLSEKTIAEEQAVAVKFIYPVMGDMKVTELNVLQIELELGALLDTVSDHKRRTMARLLKKALNLAQFFDIVQINCLDEMKYPKYYMKVIKPLKYREIVLLFSAVKDSYLRYLIYFMTLMPIRIKDIINLKFTDRIIENDSLRIENRTIVLPKTISRILDSQEVLQKQLALCNQDTWNNPQGLIFTDEYGRKLYSGKILTLLRNASKTMGIEDSLTSKNLYDTAVAMLLDSGADIKTVQYILGYKSENKYLLHLNKAGAIHTKEDLNTKFNSHMEYLINESKELEYSWLQNYLQM